MHKNSIWLGYDARETLPWAVARYTMRTWAGPSIPVKGVVLEELRELGWYTRPTSERRPPSEPGQKKKPRVLWDDISGAPMSTEFAISRFFILHLADKHFGPGSGWAMFADCDVLVRDSVNDLFHMAKNHKDKALLCVHHDHRPTEMEKKDAQPQAHERDPRFPGVYSRKNHSSVMMLNRAHLANKRLTIELLNTVPGRDLHRFCWLEDSDIGVLDQRWNHLVGVEGAQSPNPAIVHFTNGGPWLPQYAGVEYAEEWRAARDAWLGVKVYHGKQDSAGTGRREVRA